MTVQEFAAALLGSLKSQHATALERYRDALYSDYESDKSRADLLECQCETLHAIIDAIEEITP